MKKLLIYKVFIIFLFLLTSPLICNQRSDKLIEMKKLNGLNVNEEAPLQIIYYGNKILRQKSKNIKNIDESIYNLIKNMTETMIESKGVGLAAPQVGLSIRLFIAHFCKKDENGKYIFDAKPSACINPKILSISEEKISMEEGCLSLPGLSAIVARPSKIKVEYTNESGEVVVKELKDLSARIFMHENDHLNGVLYIDRIDKKARDQLKDKLLEIKQKYNKEN